MIFPVTAWPRCSAGSVYEVVRQTGSHLRLKSNLRGVDHHVTIPAHKTLKLGTLNGILIGIAAYLETDRSQLMQELFEK